MLLSTLLAGVDILEVAPSGFDLSTLDIAEVRDDSRAVKEGDLFVALRGHTVDGHRFLSAVNSANAAVVEELVSRETFTGAQIRVSSSALSLARIAANRYGRPAESMKMIGITGTNGKTTTTFLTESLIRAGGGEPGVLGTVAYRYKNVSREAPFTTPTPLELHRTLAEMRDAGCTHIAMECSSHALELGRLEGMCFAVAAFTNLTQDHLDFHGTMEAYASAKKKLFHDHLIGTAAVLVDREYGEEMAHAAVGKVLRISAQNRPADISVARAAHSIAGIDATFKTPVGTIEIRSPLIGAFNLENLAVAVGIGCALELSSEQISRGLGSMKAVPGRLERVENDRGFDVFVDYAHTPDALERVMAALRPLTRGRLLVVFGCGGDRDRTKRPIMGQVVARDADLAIVTSDNPRTEEPNSIVEMIAEGVRRESSPLLSESDLAVAVRGHVVIVDRKQAIAGAVSAARPGDVLLIAGKGHEDYQIIGKVKHPFDDRKEAAQSLEKLAKPRESLQS